MWESHSGFMGKDWHTNKDWHLLLPLGITGRLYQEGQEPYLGERVLLRDGSEAGPGLTYLGSEAGTQLDHFFSWPCLDFS